jgi:hypothetical protein
LDFPSTWLARVADNVAEECSILEGLDQAEGVIQSAGCLPMSSTVNRKKVLEAGGALAGIRAQRTF